MKMEVIKTITKALKGRRRKISLETRLKPMNGLYKRRSVVSKETSRTFLQASFNKNCHIASAFSISRIVLVVGTINNRKGSLKTLSPQSLLSLSKTCT